MKISEVIKSLKKFQKEFGDVPVIMATDEEGNSYGSLDRELSFQVTDRNEAVILYPFEQSQDYEDVAIEDEVVRARVKKENEAEIEAILNSMKTKKGGN